MAHMRASALCVTLLASASGCDMLGSGECDEAVRACVDGDVYSDYCGELTLLQTCPSYAPCSQASTLCEEEVSENVGAILTFENGPFGFITANFVHADIDSSAPELDSCRSRAASEIPESESRPLPGVAVTQVLVEDPNGVAEMLPEYNDGPYPYYLMAIPPEWDADAVAGTTWNWYVAGTEEVPDFSVEFGLPEPFDGTPLPAGGGVVDFSLSAPPTFEWSSPTVALTTWLVMSASGVDQMLDEGRYLTCWLRDDGAFQLPPQEAMKFRPGVLTIGLSRVSAVSLDGKGLSGGGYASSSTTWMPVDSEGAAIPLNYYTRP